MPNRPNSDRRMGIQKDKKNVETVQQPIKTVAIKKYRILPINRVTMRLNCGHTVFEDIYKKHPVCFVCVLIAEGKWPENEELPWEFVRKDA